MAKTKVFVMHSSHLDLFWIGAQADCLSTVSYTHLTLPTIA